jgi:mannitol/fructose-specific phosphotransferase system IIA component (Ntr-type)
MRFSDLLKASTVVLELPKGDRFEAIRHLVDALASEELLANPERAYDAVVAREKVLSTGVGSGIAVPHATLNSLTKPCVAFGRSQQGIDFEAIDHKPVHLVFLLLSPGNEYDLHLRMLSRISRLCTEEALRNQLRLAPTAESVLDLLQEREIDLPDLKP